ncbi:hypothetical protein CSB20_09315 [bacterium DOLZORAL124_64_63]|nr:MAG: hypothetical protein CSB20_09315 [bacterium DOLZORAL124_64_63]
MARRFAHILIVAVLMLMLMLTTGTALAGGPTIRQKVYEKLSRAQEAVEAQEYDKANRLLEDVAKYKDLSPNETAQLYNAFGYTYFNQERYADAAQAYEKVLQQEDLAPVMRTGTLYTLGQLHFHLENYDKALSFLQDWLAVAENPSPEAYILVGQAHYQLGQLAEAAAPVHKAIAVARERGREPQENWYALLRVIYFDTKEYDKLLDVLETLVTHWPAKEYWLHLSGAYGEMGDTDKQLAAYEMAHQQGYLQRSSELVLLAQLLLQAEVPYRAGVILQEGLDSGAIDSTATNWRLLSQAWILAQEHEAAIASLRKAAQMGDDSELYARIAQSHANLGQWEQAAEVAATAIAKGVDDSQNMHMLRGMAFYELNRFDQAKLAFAEAAKADATRNTATKWLSYVEREEARLKDLGAR